MFFACTTDCCEHPRLENPTFGKQFAARALSLLGSSFGRFCALGVRKDSPSRGSPICCQSEAVSARHLQDDTW